MKEKKHGLLTNAMRKAMKKSRNDDEMLANLAIASKALDDDDLFIVTGGAQYEANESALSSFAKESVISQDTKDAMQNLLNDVGPSPISFISSDANTNSSNASVLQSDNVHPAVSQKDEPGVFNQQNINIDINLVGIDNVNNLQIPSQNQGNEIQAVNGSQVSVDTGGGDDLFKFSNDIKGQLNSGKGDDTFILDQAAQEKAEISVDAGDGFDVMEFFGQSKKHSFSFKNGKFHMN